MGGEGDYRNPAPWRSPFYRGAIKGYTREQCPQSLGYLGRAIMLSIDQTFTLEDADAIVSGVQKVASALL